MSGISVVVDALLQGHDQGGGDVVALQRLQGLLCARGTRSAPRNCHQRFALEAVELQIDLEPRHVGRQALGEARLAGDAQAVGVDHQVADRAGPGAPPPGSRRTAGARWARRPRSAPGPARPRTLPSCPASARPRPGGDGRRRSWTEDSAKHTGQAQVAGLVDLEDRQAGMLLVVGAQAAVVGAAVVGASLDVQRPVARLEPVLLRFPVRQVVGDQRLLDAMLATALQVVRRCSSSAMILAGNQRQAGLHTGWWSGPGTDTAPSCATRSRRRSR
jgi:hypothetical protein